MLIYFKLKSKSAVGLMSFTSRPSITYRSLPSRTHFSFIYVSASLDFLSFLRIAAPAQHQINWIYLFPGVSIIPQIFARLTLSSPLSFYQMPLSGISAHSHQSVLNFISPFTPKIPILLILFRSCSFYQDIDSEAGKDWKPKGEGDSRGWNSYITSLTQWTWIWGNSGRQWRTWESGVLQSTRSLTVRVNQWLANNCNPPPLLKFIVCLSPWECNNTGQKDFSVLFTAVFQSIEQFLASNCHLINISKIN